jgi:iron complex outermembrane receptor protein
MKVFFRVYNTEYDRIKYFGNFNAALVFENAMNNTSMQIYVKNILNDDPIVDAFTNSDDAMLTTNVFTLDPRVWGISISKRF